MSLRDEVEKVRKRHRRLTADLLVAAGSDPEKFPLLNAEFAWDDAEAGHEYRLIQANRLVQRLKVAYTDSSGVEQHIRAYVSQPNPKGPGRTYRPVEDVAQDELARHLVLAEMERDWRALKRRYDQFDEFTQLILADLGAA